MRADRASSSKSRIVAQTRPLAAWGTRRCHERCHRPEPPLGPTNATLEADWDRAVKLVGARSVVWVVGTGAPSGSPTMPGGEDDGLMFEE